MHMNPSREGTQSNFELPAQPQSNETDNQQLEKAAETPAARPEQAGKQAKQPVLPTTLDELPVADTPTIAIPGADDNARSQSDHRTQSDDSDRIDPVWINKTKAVISQTRNDPYEQKVQMSKVKAEYIEKRFNKKLKTDEAHK